MDGRNSGRDHASPWAGLALAVCCGLPVLVFLLASAGTAALAGVVGGSAVLVGAGIAIAASRKGPRGGSGHG